MHELFDAYELSIIRAAPAVVGTALIAFFLNVREGQTLPAAVSFMSVLTIRVKYLGIKKGNLPDTPLLVPDLLDFFVADLFQHYDAAERQQQRHDEEVDNFPG